MKTLAGFTHRKFPMVIAIEDLHLMQEDLSEVLQQNCGRCRESSDVGRCDSLARDIERGTMWISFSQEGVVENLEVAQSPLSAESLSAIVRELYPDTPDDVCQSIARTNGATRTHSSSCSPVKISRKRVSKTTATIRSLTPEEDLAHRPSTIADLYGERWEPSPVEKEQTALMAAVVSLPSASVESPSRLAVHH